MQYDAKNHPSLNQIWTKRWDNVGCSATHPTAKYTIKQPLPLSQNSQVEAEVNRESDAPQLA
jgi:hypothetical protein